jgi:hypothetical protein
MIYHDKCLVMIQLDPSMQQMQISKQMFGLFMWNLLC